MIGANEVRGVSVATQKLLAKAGKSVVADCPTRWSSSFYVVSHLLELRWDSLLSSEWCLLEDIHRLLLPFASHRNIIQTDNIALGNVLPVIVDLQCHLEEPSLIRTEASILSHSMLTRFSKYLDVNHEDFDPMPAAVCLLSPDVMKVIVTHDTGNLLTATEQYILNEVFTL